MGGGVGDWVLVLGERYFGGVGLGCLVSGGDGEWVGDERVMFKSDDVFLYIYCLFWFRDEGFLMGSGIILFDCSYVLLLLNLCNLLFIIFVMKLLLIVVMVLLWCW